jgi:hypothetical protein
MSKRSFMEIFSGACAEIGRNVSEDLLDLRNQCMAKANDVCTNASATVAAKVSAAVQHCKDECRAFADTARVFGIGGSYATSALGGSYATSALGGSLRTVLQRPPQASDFVILRIAEEMYNGSPDWQVDTLRKSVQQLSLSEFKAKMLMVCRTPDCPRVYVAEAVDTGEDGDNHFAQIMKLHYEYLRQKNDKAMLAEFVRTYPIEEDAAPRAKRRRVHFAADAVQVAAEEVATEEVAEHMSAWQLELISQISDAMKERKRRREAFTEDSKDSKDSKDSEPTARTAETERAAKIVNQATDQAIDVVVQGCLHEIITQVVHNAEVAELEQFGESLLVTP